MAAPAAGSVRDGGVGMLALGSPLWVAGMCCLLSAAGEAEMCVCVCVSLSLDLNYNPCKIFRARVPVLCLSQTERD